VKPPPLELSLLDVAIETEKECRSFAVDTLWKTLKVDALHKNLILVIKHDVFVTCAEKKYFRRR
jgi:hypothetical protein